MRKIKLEMMKDVFYSSKGFTEKVANDSVLAKTQQQDSNSRSVTAGESCHELKN